MKKKIFMTSIFCFLILLLYSCKSKNNDEGNQPKVPNDVGVEGIGESPSDIFVRTEDDQFSLKLQRGTYEGSSWIWTDTETLSVSNIVPGDSAFFRIVIVTSKDLNLNMNFSGIESSAGDLIDVLNGYARMSLVNKYNVIDDKVEVTEGGLTKTLYNISYNRVYLCDYKVEDIFRFYDYGICMTSSDTTESGKSSGAVLYNGKQLDNFVLDDGITPSTLDKASANYMVRLWGDQMVAFAYFALEFNIKASLVNYSYTFDGETITCSDRDLYKFQQLDIKRINIEEVNN